VAAQEDLSEFELMGFQVAFESENVFAYLAEYE